MNEQRKPRMALETRKDEPFHFPGLHPDLKTNVAIDGWHLFQASRSLDFEVDYKALRTLVADNSMLLRATYFTAIVENEGEFSPLVPLVDWLSYNDYVVTTKPALQWTDSETGRRRVKGSMDSEIAVSLMESAFLGGVEQVLLIAGVSDLRPAVEAIQRRNVRVVVCSTIKTNPPMISDDLRRQADAFADLAVLRDVISRRKRAE